jgi:hypothetical protein
LKVASRIPAPYDQPVFKALCCSMMVFLALGAVGIWLRRKRAADRDD